MKSTRLMAAAVLLATLIYFGCKKSTSTENGGYTPQMTTATISGRVTDDNKSPVSGATVKVGEFSTTTDINGLFSIANASIDQNAGYVKVEKDSFFLGTKTIVIKPGKDNSVSVQLIKKTVAGTFKGTDGGTVTIPASGGNIMFQPGSVINSTTNAAYTGAVTVSAFYFNPTQSNFNDIIPGALRGLTTANLETGLQSFSMMAVELNGAAGEKLQLASGKPATITFPIPTALLAQAPATIPLWYLDEGTGLWREEGTATKQGNNYIGQVKHFSFWNCDAPFPVIDFSAVIKTQQGAALTDGTVVIRPVDSSASYGSGYINTDGTVGGKIPANRALTMIVYNKCGNELYRKNIGPFATNTDLGTITVNAGTPVVVAFSGTVVNCSQQAVTNGFVTVQLEGQTYRANISNGSFNISISRCTNITATASLIAYNLTTNEGGTATTFEVKDQPINAGALTACGTSLTQYINYTIDGVQYSYTAPQDTLNTNLYTVDNVNDTFMTILGQRRGSYNQFYASFKGGITTPELTFLSIAYSSGNQLKYYVKTPQPISVTYTEYGKTANYVAGSLSGSVKDSAISGSSSYPFTCTFRIRRK